MAGNARLVADYLEAFASGDFEAGRRMVTDELSFSGPVTQTAGKEDFFAASAALVPLMRGYHLLRQLASSRLIFDTAAFLAFMPET